MSGYWHRPFLSAAVIPAMKRGGETFFLGIYTSKYG
jgi:hypothetical protein